MPLSTLFPLLDAQNLFRHLRDTAAPYDIIFADIARISNSRMSLEASEFAKEHGRFDQFHRAHFRTYFSQGIDIGSLEVLAQTGHDAGLDRISLVQSLQSGKFLPMIENMQKEAARLGVTAAPTIIIEGKDRYCRRPAQCGIPEETQNTLIANLYSCFSSLSRICFPVPVL
jgi:predicted DsbA family dithiol-disulfide isomerase